MIWGILCIAAVTNHSLGFQQAFKIIANTLAPNGSTPKGRNLFCLMLNFCWISQIILDKYYDIFDIDNFPGKSEIFFFLTFLMVSNINKCLFFGFVEDAMIVYVSRGLLSSLIEAKDVLQTIATENGRLENRVIINTYAVIDGRCYQTGVFMFKWNLWTRIFVLWGHLLWCRVFRLQWWILLFTLLFTLFQMGNQSCMKKAFYKMLPIRISPSTSLMSPMLSRLR